MAYSAEKQKFDNIPLPAYNGITKPAGSAIQIDNKGPRTVTLRKS